MADRQWVIGPGEDPVEVEPQVGDFGVDRIRRPRPIGPIIGASLTESGIVIPIEVLEQMDEFERQSGEKSSMLVYLGHEARPSDFAAAQMFAGMSGRIVLLDEAEPGTRRIDDEPMGRREPVV